MSKPKWQRRAMAWPIRPIPRMPTVLPVRCIPSICVGCQPSHLPDRTSRSPSPARRAVISISVMAMSAVASVTAPGVLLTSSPAARAAAERDALEAAKGVPTGGTSTGGKPPPPPEPESTVRPFLIENPDLIDPGQEFVIPD